MNCKNCGAILNSDDIFCRQCGHAVNNDNNNPVQNNETQGFNSYQNNANNRNTGMIVLCVALAIVFWIVGFVGGKFMWGDDNGESLNINSTPSISQENSSETNNQNNEQKNTNVSKNSSYIVTDNGTKVYFEVNDELVEDAENSDADYRCFYKEKGDDFATIWISEEYDTVAEYMEEVEDDANRMQNDSEYYNNVKLSEIKTKKVNGLQFTYRTIDYNMGDSEFHDLHIAYEIAEDSLYTLEIEEYQLLNDSELNGLLNITIEK